MLRKDVVPGLVIMATAPVIWELGRLTRHPGHLRLVTVMIVVVAVVALAVAVTH